MEFGEDVAKSVSELAVKWACGFGSAPLEYDRRSPRKDAIGFVEDWHDGFSEKAKAAVSSSVSAFELARYSQRRFSGWYAELSVRIPGFSVTDRMQLVMIPGLRYVVQPAGFAVFQAH